MAPEDLWLLAPQTPPVLVRKAGDFAAPVGPTRSALPPIMQTAFHPATGHMSGVAAVGHGNGVRPATP
jgi:hypothetical protein